MDPMLIAQEVHQEELSVNCRCKYNPTTHDHNMCVPFAFLGVFSLPRDMDALFRQTGDIEHTVWRQVYPIVSATIRMQAPLSLFGSRAPYDIDTRSARTPK